MVTPKTRGARAGTNTRSGAASIPLKVIAVRPARSTMGRWRALCLIAVHLLIAIHVAHWLTAGETLTPLEPSEAMEFSKNGIVNAGLIFFALMTLSTLVLGRWFCGWACHLVAVQDLSSWLLAKARIRPRPLRSRLLATLPVIAFFYMFVGPLFYHWVDGAEFHVRGFDLVRGGFWDTFPSWTPAILALLVCGFLSVYFLGQKGFCTNACPYGGIFAPVDRLAALRIRVNDDCDGNGHCTAVCSSNVRVHEEIRTHGGVVDPGCMKCLDCVSACPNDALYVGWGAPAVLMPRSRSPHAGERPAAHASSERAGSSSALPQELLRAAFVLLAVTAFVGYDVGFGWSWRDAQVVALTWASAMIVLLLMGRGTRPKRELPLWQEALLGGAFLLAMLAFRGLYGLIAFLFALALGGVVAYLGLYLARMMIQRNVNAHGWILRRAGKIQPWGVAFGLASLGFAAFMVHGGFVQTRRLTVVRTERSVAAALASGMADVSSIARAGLDQARALREISLLWSEDDELRLARLARLSGDPAQFERRMAALIESNPEQAGLRLEMAEHLQLMGRVEEAMAQYRSCLEDREEQLAAGLNLGLLLTAARRFDEAESVYDSLVSAHPRSSALQQNMGILEAERGNMAEAVGRLAQAVNLDATSLSARIALARALATQGRWQEAAHQFAEAADRAPGDVNLLYFAGAALMRAGQADRAARYLERAAALAPQRLDVQRELEVLRNSTSSLPQP